MMFGLLKISHKPIWKQAIVLVGIIIAIFLVASMIASSQDYYKKEGKDFFSLWLAPHLLLEGKSPYTQEDWVPAQALYGAQWVPDSTFLYPLPLAVVLIPMGLLPLEYASVLWVVMTIAAVLIACHLTLSIWQKKWPNSYIIPILAGVFLFRPVAVTFRLGQIDWLLLICLAVGLYLWDKQKWLAGGMLIELTVLKPQIGAPLLAFLSLWLVLRRLWLGLMGEGITLVGLFVVGWLFNHSWLWQWLDIGKNKVESSFCCTPTLWGLASMICKFDVSCGFSYGIVLAGVLCVIMIFILIPIPKGEARFALGLSIPAALLISPYLWVYSQAILVIPILMIMCILARRHRPYLLVATFPLVMALFASGLVFLSIRVGADVLSSIVPLIILLLLWLLRIYYLNGAIPSVDEAVT